MANTITLLPGAHFASAVASAEYIREAWLYERAVAQFTVDGEEAALWEDLSALGFDAAEVQWHVDNRGQRMERGYGKSF